MAKEKPEQANQGDLILFTKKQMDIIGEVLVVRENTVIVSMSPENARELDCENDRTVVNHSSYEILQRSSKPVEEKGVKNPFRQFTNTRR